MHFDLKTPIGWMFTVYGGLLVLYGALGDPAQYSRSLEINVNAVWGIVLLTFGVLMLNIGRPRK
jgi:hypothetical protein